MKMRAMTVYIEKMITIATKGGTAMKGLAVAAILGSFCLGAADVANLSGTWVLKVEKSRWGKKPKPTSMVVEIEHQEPTLKYRGVGVDDQGVKNEFQFEGAIDGKEYSRDSGLKTVIKRVNKYTVTSTTSSADGRVVTQATTVVSADGNTLTRTMHQKGSDGDVRWTEVYERK
jgi:hypothetical protein